MQSFFSASLSCLRVPRWSCLETVHSSAATPTNTRGVQKRTTSYCTEHPWAMAASCPLTWRPSQSVVPHVRTPGRRPRRQTSFASMTTWALTPRPPPPGGRRRRRRGGGGAASQPATGATYLFPHGAWLNAPHRSHVGCVPFVCPRQRDGSDKRNPRVVVAACPHLEGGGGGGGTDMTRQEEEEESSSPSPGPDPPCSLSSFVTRLLVLGARGCWTHWWFTQAPGRVRARPAAGPCVGGG